MCRMIAAVGSVELEPLKEALRAMALNRNPVYEHEHRSRGDALMHDCGWGAAFVTPDGLSVIRSTRPCFDDPDFDSLSTPNATVAVLHARRNRDRGTIALENTHPFTATLAKAEYAFFHNGELRDRGQLTYGAQFVPRGTCDSEELFYHLLTRFDDRRPLESIESALSGIRDFTSLNCLLVAGDALLGYAGMSEATEYVRYYTLWRASGSGVSVVSSEIVGGLDVEWAALPVGHAFRVGA